MLTMILAIDRDGLVGSTEGKYGLAWHYPEDMEFYKAQCINKVNVYGRKTLEAIGRKLPNREMYCLTRNKNFHIKGITNLYSTDDVLKLAKNQEVMVNGGVEIFKSLFEYIDKIILTRIDASHVGDVYYKELDLSEFKNIDTVVSGILSFEIWERQ